MTIENAKLYLSYCNLALALTPFFVAIAGYGKYYFEKEIKALESAPVVMTANSFTVSKDGEATLSQDAPLIIEAIEVSVGFSFSAYLDAGMQISGKPDQWFVSGKNIVSIFTDAWNFGKVDLSKDNGVFLFDILDPRLKLAAPFGSKLDVSIKDLRAVYALKKKYFLGYSSMLPSAGDTKDMISNRNVRTFKMSDVFKFREIGFKEYDKFEDIPKQQAEIIQFRLVPKIDQSILQNFSLSIQKIDR